MEQLKTTERILQENDWRRIIGHEALDILSDIVKAHVLDAWAFHPRMERDIRPKMQVREAIESDPTKEIIETQSGDQDYLCMISKELE